MLKIYTQFRYIVFLFCCGLFWQGCNVINPTEQTPTYIHIDSFNFLTNPLMVKQPLTLSHTITCIWVYYNNQNIGVFDLPATIPIMAKGTAALEVFPGIAVDGQNDMLAQYPFYEPDTFTFAAQPGKIINHIATTRFYQYSVVTPISDFTVGTGFALNNGNIPMTVVTGDSTGINGNYGHIYLSNPGVDSSEDSTVKVFTIPTGTAFIEFNYKNTIPFYIGLQSNLGGASTSPYYLTGIYPSSEWQKFYLSVQDFAAQYPGSSYNLYIKASLPSGGPGYVSIDNIQLISH